jgi:serine/threonine protein kinase
MTMVGEWEQLDPLGEGGQGKVYRARRPKRVREREDAVKAIIENSPFGIYTVEERRAKVDRFASAVWNYAHPDDSSELGALKIFKFDPDKAKASKALARFKNEITILRQDRPGLIRLLDCSENGGWMVTEFMRGGTIEQHPDTFKGDARRALKAFQSLVKTVVSLHQEGTVHRDIKPANIFIGDDGNLVLGDFGIVFLLGQAERPTVTDERVGSRDYMPPWADLGERLEDVSPDFDVYMLGKLLWCTVSGRLKLHREDFKRERFDLTVKFPNNPDMHAVNALLEKCIVSEQKDCLPSAHELLPLVEETVARLERGGQLLKDGIPRPCRICGEGFYRPHEQRGLTLRIWRGGSDTFSMPIRPFICQSCHHIEFFNEAE